MSGHERTLEVDATARKTRRFRCDPALRRLLQELNARYFDNTLPLQEYAVAWSRKADDDAGAVWPYSFTHEKPLISISADLQHNPERLRHTALHELVHVKLTPNRRIKEAHGPTFKREMRRLERAGGCRIPTFRFEYRDPVTGVSERHALKAW